MATPVAGASREFDATICDSTMRYETVRVVHASEYRRVEQYAIACREALEAIRDRSRNGPDMDSMGSIHSLACAALGGVDPTLDTPRTGRSPFGPFIAEFDKGPWIASKVGAYVESLDIAHGARFNISGDFEDINARYAYACALAATLNHAREVLSSYKDAKP